MPATIQTILKPTRARALDTSTSLQAVTGNLITNSDFTIDDSSWVEETGWSINHGTGIASCDGTQSASTHLHQSDVDLLDPDGKMWRVIYTVSAYTAGTVKVQIGGYGPASSGKAATGTYTEILGPTDDRSIQRVYISGSDDFIGSVSNITVERMESFGNNNHGQIYSGRALEFDGVSDYLQVEDIVLPDLNTFTMAIWLNFPNAFTANYGPCFMIGENQFNHNDHFGYIGTHSDDNKIVFGINKTGGGTRLNIDAASDTLSPNTWYRVVGIYDGTEDKIYLYINGSLISTDTPSDQAEWSAGDSVDFTTGGNDLFLGAGTATANQIEFLGSDAQFWDKAWSAADVTYDYLNPEQLALNRGGTSLTESNLKLWYPMQDGHRGQQSFILDGANTGLGSDIYVFSNGTGWGYSGGVLTATDTDYDANTGINPVIGEVYQISYEITSISEGGVFFRAGGVQTTTQTTTGTYTENLLMESTAGFVFRTIGELTATIENITLKGINAKNHATTAFYGDELVTNGDMELDDNWADTSTPETNEQSTVDKHSGSYSRHIVDSTPNYAGVQSDAFTTVAGITYKISVWYKNIGTAAIRLSWLSGDASLYSNTINLTADSWTQYTTYYTETTGGSGARVNFINASNSNPAEFYIDDVSIKEVGTATGWTDADQQLDIPQTALQSYNQLAWFDGANDYVRVGYDNSLDVTSITISAWVNLIELGVENVVAGKAYNTAFEFGVSTTNKVHVNAKVNDIYDSHMHNSGTALLANTWNHIVWTYDRSGNSSKTYLNGVLQDTVTPVAGAGGGLATNTSPLYIGGRDTGSLFWNGVINEVGIWSSAITLAEVQAIFNDGMALDVSSDSGDYASSDDLVSYWRNNGLATWTDLKGSNNGTPTNITETLLIPAGVDGSRDTQGFIMNRQRTTSSLICLYLYHGDLWQDRWLFCGLVFAD